MNRFVGVLTRFRTHAVGFVADIERMFHAFFVTPEHRNALCFFWWRDNDPTQDLVPYRALVHIFGNKSSPAVANFALRYTTRSEEAQQFPNAVEYINKNFYVDDGLRSEPTVEEAIQTLKDSRALLQKYNIRLHKIVSNNVEVINAFPVSEIGETCCQKELGRHPEQGALGVSWDLPGDVLKVRCTIPIKEFTKRGILSVIGAIYDPLGFVAPVTLRGRLLQREFLSPPNGEEEKTYEWDEPLPPHYRDQWDLWLVQLEHVSTVQLARCFHPPKFSKVQRSELHVFCDASSEAVGLVLYLRQIGELGEVSVAFIFGNSKVAPRSAQTIPRLELCAALEAARAAAHIKSEIGVTIDQVAYYTDSMIVLGYLHNEVKQFKRYVHTRIENITQLTDKLDWRYVPSNLNPADIATKPHTVQALRASDWITGPLFLRSNAPELPFKKPKVEVQLPETQPRPTALIVQREASCVGNLYANNFSSWVKMYTVLKFVLLFLAGCRRRDLTESAAQQKASSMLVAWCQKEKFRETYDTLLKGDALCKQDKLLVLDPFMDDESTIRVGGRLRHASLPYHEKHPILLPRDHPLTTAVWRHFHVLGKHQGRHITNALIRQGGFFILQGKRLTTKLINNCVPCRRSRGSRATQKMADLPTDRLAEVPPFSNTGIDVFGPFVVRNGRNTRRSNATKKMWVLICTCLVSRAVHLETLSTLDTNCFQLALRRFIAIRGTCERIRSDHGTNFVGAINQDNPTLSAEDLKRGVEACGLIWEMIPPHASHFAGVWERKIASVKKIFYASWTAIGRGHLSVEEFQTLLQEAASVVNHTPLGEIVDDPNEPLPISPATLLHLNTKSSTAVETFSEAEIGGYTKRRWRYVQALAEDFWKRWRSDYLTNLQRRSKWKRSAPNILVGDVVLIKETAPRNYWPMGIVQQASPGADGLVRKVVVKCKPSPNGKARSFERAIHDLVVLVRNGSTD